MAKQKVKICKNQQCTERVNKPDAAVCAGCGSSFRGISWEFLNDEQIEKRLHPELEEGKKQVAENDAERDEQEKNGVPRMVIVCPSCGMHIPYRVGLEFCECGEYVQEELPVETSAAESPEVSNAPVENENQNVSAPECAREGNCCVKGMTSLDGDYHMIFTEEFMKIGREAVGGIYFNEAGKNKISREHAIIQLIDGAWYLSYCKKEDRNYAGGKENPIFINGRKMGRSEKYRLQVGDEIAFAELDKNDPLAAFFRVE